MHQIQFQMQHRSLFSLLLTILLVTGCSPKSNVIVEKFDSPNPVSAYVVLVRHAEKAADADDPDLTEQGRKRANVLAKLMRPIENVAVYSTDFKRTRQTAQPTADEKSVPIQIYNARDPQQLFKSIKEERNGKTFLVVGHSNTTPMLTRALDLKSSYEQLDESVYNKIFLVKLFADGQVESMVLDFPEL